MKYVTQRQLMYWATPWERSVRWGKAEELDAKWREHFEFVEPEPEKYTTASQWVGYTETSTLSSAAMPLPEAVKVLQLTEPTAEHILERYKVLQGANNFKGASVYIRDKVELAKQAALKAQQDGRLINYIKPKEKPPSSSPPPEEEAPSTPSGTAAEEGGGGGAGGSEPESGGKNPRG